jgi:hypothetical protein
MDKALTKLKETKFTGKSKETLTTIQDFVQKVRASASYVNIDYLNIEELYGLAEMDCALDKNQDPKTKEAFSRAIYLMSVRAGEEFILDTETYKPIAEQIDTLRHESHTEDPESRAPTDHVQNLYAYLSLATFKDSQKKHPLFIQFNWDLALDRALYLIQSTNSPQSIPDTDPFKWIHTGSEGAEKHNFFESPLIIRPHGGINWIKLQNTMPLETALGFEPKRSWPTVQKIEAENCNISSNKSSCLLGEVIERFFDMPQQRKRFANNQVNIIGDLICEHKRWENFSNGYQGHYMSLEPPTWQKNVNHYVEQWRAIRGLMKHARNIVFVGYSLPKSDLYFRHFLSNALAENNIAPKVYVWNPDIGQPGDVQDNYLSLFGPLARVKRLLGIAGRFGDPALLDVNRAMYLAKPIEDPGTTMRYGLDRRLAPLYAVSTLENAQDHHDQDSRPRRHIPT